MEFGHILGLWSENLLPAATLTLKTGTLVTGDTLASVVDGDPAAGFAITGKRIELLADFGAPVHLRTLALGHHNLDQGLTVQVRAYDDPDDPPDLTIAVAVGAKDRYGYRPDLWCNVDATAPLASYQYWSWAADAADNTNNIAVGEAYGTALRNRLPYGFVKASGGRGIDLDVIRNETYSGTALKAVKGFPRAAWTGSVSGSLSLIESLEAWWLDNLASTRPLLFVPDAAAAEVAFAELVPDSFRRTRIGGLATASLQIRQLSRGMVYP